MINYDQPGIILTTDNISGADVASGGVIVAGGCVRVAINDIADGASGPCYARGACTITANNAEAWVDGWPLWWDEGTAHGDVCRDIDARGVRQRRESYGSRNSIRMASAKCVGRDGHDHRDGNDHRCGHDHRGGYNDW